MRHTPKGFLLAACFALWTFPATAALLPAGQNITPGIAIFGTNIGDPGDLRGTVVASQLLPFSFAGDTGTVASDVVLQADNTYGFLWVIIVDPGGAVPIGSLRLGNFAAPFPLYGDFLLPTVGHAPSHVATFTDGSLNFVFFDLNFDENLLPGQTSAIMYANPHAPGYGLTAIYDVTAGNSTSGVFQTFGPAPEPSGLLLVAGGMSLLAAGVRLKAA